MDATENQTNQANQTVEIQRSCVGFLNVYKPKGITSHDVVAKVRKALKIKHVGHGGTLDPLAEGVLPLAIGSACRLFRFLPHDKVYVAEILLGRRTTTDDILGDDLGEPDLHVSLPTQEAIGELLGQFCGRIMQRPPMFSALHKDGKRLYELARQGKVVDVDEREVEIFSIEVLSYNFPCLRLRIACGGGTYIRSIARDLGDRLGCGGCLQALIREKSGPFVLSDAVQLGDGDTLLGQIRAPLRVLENNPGFVVLKLDEEQRRAIIFGQKLSLASTVECENASVILASADDQLIAVCTLNSEGKIKPEVVLSHAH